MYDIQIFSFSIGLARNHYEHSSPFTARKWLTYPVDTGRKLNVHKTFRRRPGRLLNVLCTFNLRPVSIGYGSCR